MRNRLRLLLVVVLIALPTALLAAPAGAVSGPMQVITVKAASSSSQTAVLEAWQRPSWSPVYRRVYGPLTAYVGYSGVGTASEGVSRTPAGAFTLTESFGNAGNPGTAMPYFTTDNLDWWVDDSASSLYNTHARCAAGSCPFQESQSEHLASYSVYKYATVIDYNRFPVVPGAGSAFFLHLSNGQPTGGCVAVPETALVWLMRWLRPGYKPAIDIGVGTQAYSLTRYRYVP